MRSHPLPCLVACLAATGQLFAQADDPGRLLLEGHRSKARKNLTQAGESYEKAARIYQQNGQLAAGRDAWFLASMAFGSVDQDERAALCSESGLALARETLPQVSRNFESILGTHITNLLTVGRYALALGLSEERLPLAERLRIPAVVVSASQQRASILLGLDRPYEALPFAEKACAIAGSLDARPSDRSARALALCARCWSGLGEWEKALDCYQREVGILRALQGQKTTIDFLHGNHRQAVGPESLIAALERLALGLTKLGRHEEVIAVRTEVLQLCRSSFGNGRPETADALCSLATTLFNLRRPTEAERYLSEMKAITEGRSGTEWRRVVADCLELEADRRVDQEPLQALALYRRALEVARSGTVQRDFTISDLELSIAAILLDQGHPADALPLLSPIEASIEELRQELRHLPPEERTRRVERGSLPARLFSLLRRAHLQRGDAEAALRATETGRARELLERLEGSRFDLLATIESNARLRGDQELERQVADCRRHCQRAEDRVSALLHSLAKASGRTDGSETERLARVRALEEELAAAHRERRVALAERARLTADAVPLASPATPAQVAAALEPDDALLVYALDQPSSTVFLVRRERPPEAVPLAISWAMATVLVGRLHDSIVPGSDRRTPGIEPDVAPQSRRSLDAVYQRLGALMPAELWQRIRSCRRIYVVPDGPLAKLPFELLPVERTGDGQTLCWLDSGPPVGQSPSASVLRALLLKSKVQVDDRTRFQVVAVGDPVFSAGPPATVPERGALIIGVEPGSQADKAGLRVADALTGYDGKELPDGESFTRISRQLEDAVDAGERRASDDITVTVWRQGLPEPLAVTVRPGHLGVALAPGGARAARAAGWGGGEGKQFAAAYYRSLDLAHLGQLARLPGTRREVDAIPPVTSEAGSEDAVCRLVGDRATEAALYELAPGARYLHLATHGIADEIAKVSYSALALTMPAEPSDTDNGFLTLDDLLSRWRGRLPSCRMVVLSACRTQVGKEQRDEAVHALPIGFFCAGAASVVASLWQVSDASTAELMTDFYRRIAAQGGSEDRLLAFWQAKQALKRKYPQPFHWAAFLYMGSPR